MTKKRVTIDKVKYTMVNGVLFLDETSVIKILKALAVTDEEIDYIKQGFEDLKWEA